MCNLLYLLLLRIAIGNENILIAIIINFFIRCGRQLGAVSHNNLLFNRERCDVVHDMQVHK